MLWIYDLETYKNFFSATFIHNKTREIKQFVIHGDRNDTQALIEFIDDRNLWLAGYNNYHFDNQILKYLWLNRFKYIDQDAPYIAEEIYKLAKAIVDEGLSDYTWKLPFRSLDLMKIGNLGQKSLKLTGTVFKWHKLQDLPIAWNQDIKDEDVKTILEYNTNDVLITERLFNLLKNQIKLRFDVSRKYGIYAHSESDSGISNRLLEKFYSESTGLHPKQFKKLRSRRPKIYFSDVVFEDIEFENDKLNDILLDVRESVYYESKPYFQKNIIIDGVKYKMGIGGLHSDDRGELYESSEETDIIDCDISSMYPTLIANNNIHPEHLGSAFIEKYKQVIDERLIAKKKSKDRRLSKEKRDENRVTADTLKITLNSTYGKMKFENHWLYDPLAALRVTINGQLYLLMLIERLANRGFKVISANTDGVITLVPKDRRSEYNAICKTWESDTNFDLEYTLYSKYARRDVNNYIALTSDGDIKVKGEFIIPDINNISKDQFMLRRGFDKPVVAIALNEYFINGTPIADTIRNHGDIYDFCTAKKTDKKFTNEFHTLQNGEANIKKLQQSVRFFISTDGGTLFKRNPEDGKVINYCVGNRVTIFNDYTESEDYNIDYGYYIHETQKIIDEIISPQLTLF